jgi:hypothetical protein
MKESNVAAVRVSVYPDWVLPMTEDVQKQLQTRDRFLNASLSRRRLQLASHAHYIPFLVTSVDLVTSQ